MANLALFFVDNTNIFPMANSKQGGQLATEYNLRSRESVGTYSKVPYFIGPSYTHSLNDFKVTSSSAELTISKGRALVNGHYIESLVDINYDISEHNQMVVATGSGEKLEGRLCIGLVANYSNNSATYGALEVEDDAVYTGITIVILPESEFILPQDNDNESTYTAHLKLATFTFTGGSIENLVDNTDRITIYDAERIRDITEIAEGKYISSDNLDISKFYVYNKKGSASSEHHSGWCDATNSLMLWDDRSFDAKISDVPPGDTNCRFLYSTESGQTYLNLIPKQPDGLEGRYYSPYRLPLPNADFASVTGGAVSPAYTKFIIDNIKSKVDDLYNFDGLGKLRGYIQTLNSKDELPTDFRNWDLGDYIIVVQDATTVLFEGTNRYPSTMYVLISNAVKTVKTGKLESKVTWASGQAYTCLSTITVNYAIPYNSTSGDVTEELTAEQFKQSYLSVAYYGVANYSYFRVIDKNGDNFIYFTDTVAVPDVILSEPIWISGDMSRATETKIGGFLNIPSDYLGSGYVRMNEDGYLQLLDYNLLATGVLAYQLGQDYTVASGLTNEGIQNELDEYVNSRVTFPNYEQIQNAQEAGVDPNYINVYITLSEEEELSQINIHSIDSRFNSVLYLHISGEANSNTIINIYDCEKVRLDISVTSVSSDPIFNLYRCGLYYDSNMLGKLNIISGLKLWYENSGEPDIAVDGMTVYRLTEAQLTPIYIDDWNESAIETDIHYSYGLKSLTFADNGQIIGCELLMTDNITSGTINDSYIGPLVGIYDFSLPIDNVLTYPTKLLSSQLKISGSYVTAYPVSVSTEQGFYMKDTNFTALSNTSESSSGTIAIESTIHKITNVNSESTSTTVPEAWRSGSLYTFKGGLQY